MNPFDVPPSSPPVAYDRPPGPPTEPVEAGARSVAPEPRRGRMVVAVFATAGLLGAAAFGVSALAAADDDAVLTSPDDDAADPSNDEDAGAGATDDGHDADDVGGGDDADDAEEGQRDDEAGEDLPDDQSSFHADGELRLDTGDGEEIIIDLDDIDAESLRELTECLGLPSFGFDDDLGELDPEQFGEEFDRFFEEFDPEQFDQFFEGLDPEQFGEGLDPEQFDRFFEEFDPEQFDQFFKEFDPEQFDQFFEEFDPEQFDEFFGDLDRIFPGLPPHVGDDVGEPHAGRGVIGRAIGPDLSGGSWLPSGLDAEQIEACLAELE